MTYMMLSAKSGLVHLFGLALALCLAGSGFAQPAPTKAPAIRFEGDFERLGSSYFGPAANLAYEIARGKQARSVQWTIKWLDGNQTPAVPRAMTFDLYAVNDFAVCASLVPLSYPHFTSDAGRKDSAPRLFDVSTFDHETIRGHCVAAKLAAEVSATHIVRPDTTEFVVSNGGRQQSFSTRTQYEPLEALGITVDSSGHDLWARDGMTRSLDPLTDADLTRAIHASPPLRLAALRILAQRIQRPVTRGCELTHSVLLKQTGPAVIKAVLDSKTLSQGSGELRLQTMRALAAIRPANDHEELLRQLLSGLEKPIEDFRLPAELARQHRVESLIGKEAAAVPQGQEAFHGYRHLEIAAALALLLGSDVAEAFAAHFRDYLRDSILRSLADQPCTEELVANSSYGADAAIALIGKVDSEKFAIPIIQRRIQAMAAIAAQHSAQLKMMIAERCNRTGGFLPNGELGQARAFCEAAAKAP